MYTMTGIRFQRDLNQGKKVVLHFNAHGDYTQRSHFLKNRDQRESP